MLSTNKQIPQELEVLSCFLLDQLPTLPRSLQSLLIDHLLIRYFPKHWYPQQPERASGFRAVSFDPNRHDGYLDPVLRLIASDARMAPKELRKALSPQIGWTVWCDPGCVSFRYHGGGGELRELWGSLPPRLATTAGSPPLPFTGLNLSPQVSPFKSRAIPIMVPSTSIRLPSDMGLAVTPPTPLREQPDAPLEAHDEPDDVAVSRHMNRPFSCRPSHSRQTSKHSTRDSTDFCPNSGAQLTPIISGDDPFLRPDSRTSSASSSSCSDHSAFSALTVSTTSTVPPAGHQSRKTSSSAAPHAANLDQIFARQHSVNLSYALSATQVPPFQTSYVFPGHGPTGLIGQTQSMASRSSSPARLPGARRVRERHFSTSVLSVNPNGAPARHGGLVLKEGPGTVTEHSGGKVGVMGGGVLLGLPKNEGCNTDKKSARGGRRGRVSQNQFSLSGLAHFM